MEKYSCIIIEDEPLAAEKIIGYVDRISSLAISATFADALEALGYITQNQVDLVFLDIKLNELSGIELLQQTTIQAKVIITTAYPDYALQGYELRITDYLLKPFTFNRFLQAVTKAQEGMIRHARDVPADFIFVKTENRLEKIMLGDILYIEGMRDYRKIHLTSKKIMTLQNFSELEKLIPYGLVCRVHKSYMVALNKIETIERSRIRIANQLIPVSDTYRNHLFKMINNHV